VSPAGDDLTLPPLSPAARRRYTLVGHEGMDLWNPLPRDAAVRISDAIPLGPGARVLDVGCGPATLLLRILERSGASGVGVDIADEALAIARTNARGRVDPSRLELRAEPFDAAAFAAHSFDAALCIGATHAAGGLTGTLRALRRLLRPGGAALVGEGHWLREPDPAYLAFLGAPRDELTDHAGNLAAAQREGFDVVESAVTGRASFDAYEDLHAANVLRLVAAHPDDPDADAFARRVAAWREAAARWGRDTLGFALYSLKRRA
jgi:SAM-dependent methyltransferase